MSSATFLPLRTRPLPSGEALCVSDAGQFFVGSTAFLGRLAAEALSEEDWTSLKLEGVAVDEGDELGARAYVYGIVERLARAGPLDYLILVPTLRCNLNCSYCQVSRAGIRQPGFDWSDETLTAVLKLLDELPTQRLKVEFQGGEPTLRPDLIRAVIDRCERFPDRQFVICTNLQELSPEILALFDREDVYISTSLDGDAATHERQRTGRGPAKAATDAFLENLAFVLGRYGGSKVSALPTIDPAAPPGIDDLIESYASRGFNSIFLRPINYQGFARKRHTGSREQSKAWRDYHRAFVRKLIARNWQDRSRALEESYFSICLRRVFQPGRDRYVDLRNPNPMGLDYVVVDHDGQVYPTDEARMLSRAGVVDLAIGDVHDGWASPRRETLNFHSTNQFDPACQRCTYQPFCGRDLVDDLSRYGRIDLPRNATEFCRRHLSLFDFIFELIYEDDPAVRYSLSRWLRLPGTPAVLGTRVS
jgi:His-Xaa-Ser system radical SAM maturase HxsB